MKVIVNPERCKGCQLCVVHCPGNVFQLSPSFNQSGYHYAEVAAEERCTGCRRCILICPDVAIELYQEKKLVKTKGEK
ncbi:MAG: ferredoxin family protein [Candidatus Omnitrophica bacterium]|nr:ferredoxin family protein [Candidatus Omnitrophota bacterium]